MDIHAMYIGLAKKARNYANRQRRKMKRGIAIRISPEYWEEKHKFWLDAAEKIRASNPKK